MKLRILLFVGAATIFSPLGAEAYAQTGSAPANGSAQSDNEAPVDLQTVIVTAQRRAENLQDVPIAITAVTADMAKSMGITGSEGLAIATPGLVFSRSLANGGVPFLRGVGTASGAVGTESSVAVYIDDVYIGALSANVFSFNNIENVEVLKGPQGTLFGRNATAGVVHVHTKNPSQTPEFNARIGYGNYDTVEGSIYANQPISETLSVNFAAAGQKQNDGYGRSFISGEEIYKGEDWGVRGGLLWKPSSDTSVLLKGDFSKSRGDDGLNPVLRPGTVAVGGGRNQGKFVSLDTPADFSRVKQYGGSLKLNHDTSWAQLVSISAYRVADLYYRLDQDSVPPIVLATVDQSTKTFSQEFQILSPDSSRLKWILGMFYFRSNAQYSPLRVEGASQAPLLYVETFDRQKLKSIAGFGEVKYDLLPKTNLTAGIRYTRDKYDLDAVRFSNLGAVPGQTFTGSNTQSEWTYRAILDHSFTDKVMGYASYSRGFKSGGYNLSTPNLPPVEPEILDAYEVGLKSVLFDGMLRLNASAFHYKYSNLQVVSSAAGLATTINAGAARINGADVDFSFRPTSRFSLSGGLAFLDAEYTSFPNGPLFVANPAVCTPVPATTGPMVGGFRQCSADLSGNRLVYSPKFTGSLTAAYTLPTERGDFTLAATLYHTAKSYFGPDNNGSNPSYNLVNSSLEWRSPDDRYEVRLWAKNLLNEYYFTFGNRGGLRDAVRPAMPRSYGVSFGVQFQ